MRTKAQIVQELLDKKLINAEDAVVLLESTAKEYVYTPLPMPTHPTPTSPFIPLYPKSHYRVWCGSNTSASLSLANN